MVCFTGIYSPDKGATINGVIQLYSVEQKQEQKIDGFAPCFAELPLLAPNVKNNVIVLIGKKSTDVNGSLLVLEVGTPSDPTQKIKRKQMFQSAPDVGPS